MLARRYAYMSEEILDNESYDIASLIGEFEKAYEQDEKIAALSSQIKMLKKDNSDAFAEYAKDHGMKPKHVTDAYKHWKAVKESEDGLDSEDALYELLARIDMYLEKENGDSEEK